MSTEQDELEALLKAAQTEGETRPLTEVERFIEENEIAPSEFNKIANFNIYALYEKWSPNPVTREAFFKEFATFFKRCCLPRPEQERGYYIICNRIQHNEEARWKQYEWKRELKKKRQQAKKNKTSRS